MGGGDTREGEAERSSNSLERKSFIYGLINNI